MVAGINRTTGKPFICGFDSIGCIDFAKDFIVSGTASDQLFGTCEGLWEPDLVRSVPSRDVFSSASGWRDANHLFSVSVGARRPF